VNITRLILSNEFLHPVKTLRRPFLPFPAQNMNAEARQSAGGGIGSRKVTAFNLENNKVG